MATEECVVAMYKSLDSARSAVEALSRSQFPNKQVSLVASGVEDEKELRKALQTGDEAQKDAAVGAGVGGLVGVLVGASLLTIPGVGLLFIAGPIAAGFTGAVVGAFLGALGGWGVHKDHIAQYEEEVRSGKLLVIAHGDPAQVALAERVLTDTDYTKLHLHAADSSDSPEIDD